MTGWIGLFVVTVCAGLFSRQKHLLIPILAIIGIAGAVDQAGYRLGSSAVSDLRPGIDIAHAAAATELKATNAGHYIADAEINGTVLKVMVDTGASAVVMSYEDADEIGLWPRSLDYDVPVATANGMLKAARVTLRRVDVDNVTVRDVEGLVLPEGVMSGTLLGMSFLNRLSSFRVEDGVLYLRD
ncbi:TIGR02281 family clan AA aspartic protease [soil metagenome]